MTFEKEYVIGIDCSTKTIGISLLDITGRLIELDHVSLPVNSKKNGIVSIYNKANFFKERLKQFDNYKIKHIFVEAPLKNGPNINTTILLAQFNGIISKILCDKFNVEPEHITVYDSRKLFFPEYITYKKEKGILKEVLSFPSNIDIKKLVWDKVAWLEPQANWDYTKIYDLKKENYDRADSYVVAKSSLLLKKYIEEIPKLQK